MFAIEAERQPKKVGLLGIRAEALVGEIAEFIGHKVQDGERLLFTRGVSAVAAVQENGKVAVGRNSRSRWEIIDLAGGARNGIEQFSIRKLYGRWRCIRLREKRHCENTQSREHNNDSQNRASHPRIIGILLKE